MMRGYIPFLITLYKQVAAIYKKYAPEEDVVIMEIESMLGCLKYVGKNFISYLAYVVLLNPTKSIRE